MIPIKKRNKEDGLSYHKFLSGEKKKKFYIERDSNEIFVNFTMTRINILVPCSGKYTMKKR
jgi:hypothetical protein